MLTDDEKMVLIGLIEDEMQIVDYESVYPKDTRELLESALRKLKET